MWNLEKLPLPFEANSFDEIAAYHVIEHCTGRQGEVVPFFAFFTEMHRLLKPGGIFAAMVPRWDSKWAWGDPDHRRIISDCTLVYLSQSEYKRQIGVTAMSDYRHIYKADFDILTWDESDVEMWFVLQAVGK